MNHSEGTLLGSGGLELYYQSWLPESTSDEVIIIVHGISENCRHYTHVVDYFVDNGNGVFGFDLRGHGKSYGQEGHIMHFSEYREDLRLFIEKVRNLNPDAKIFLFCSSLGALIGADYLEHTSDGFSGAVISGIPIVPTGVASPLTMLLARIMSLIFPKFSIDLGSDPTKVTRDINQQNAIRDDALMHRFVTARWGTECLRTVKEVQLNSDLISSPVLIVHGGNDKLNEVRGAVAFFESIPYSDKTLKIYPDAYHNIHDDLDWELELKDVKEWIERH